MSALFRARAVDFDRLYRDHAPSVYRYAFAVLGNQADAEDVTQQTFLNAYRSIAGGTRPRKAENWLLRIAHNEVRRHFRKSGAAVEVEFEDRIGDEATDDTNPRLADVLRALRKLPPNQRAALVMREFEGRSYAEIASVMEVTQGALEALLFRARRGLAQELEDALTCPEAEQALSRSLDDRLPRRESRKLKEHMRECVSCVRFATVQKRQRSVLKGLSVMPLPASLFLVRGEHAAAAGLGGGAAAGSTATVMGGGAATGIAAKAAAVAATAVVAGGTGYGVATKVVPKPQARAEAAQRSVVAAEVRRPARLGAPLVRRGAPVVVSAKPRSADRRAARKAQGRRGLTKRLTATPTRARGTTGAPGRLKARPGAKTPRPARPERLSPARGKRLGAAKRVEPKRPSRGQQRGKAKPPGKPAVPPDPAQPGAKKKS